METIIVVAVILLVLYLVFKLFKTLFKWLLIVIVVVAVIAFFSNPNFDDHSKKLTSMKKDLKKELNEKKVIFDDYKIFSLTKKKIDGEEKVVGVGAFGKVWYFDENDK